MITVESPKAGMVSGSIARPDCLDFDTLVAQDSGLVHRSLSEFPTTEPAIKSPLSPTLTTVTLVKTKASNVFNREMTMQIG